MCIADEKLNNQLFVIYIRLVRFAKQSRPVMDLIKQLQAAFTQFISNSVQDDMLLRIKHTVTPADVSLLIMIVESLDDPGSYCKDGFNDTMTVAGFFLFIDFIVVLIINLGEPAIKEVQNYRTNKHPFVLWIIQYVTDNRFHNAIMLNFMRVFTE